MMRDKYTSAGAIRWQELVDYIDDNFDDEQNLQLVLHLTKRLDARSRYRLVAMLRAENRKAYTDTDATESIATLDKIERLARWKKNKRIKEQQSQRATRGVER